MILLTLPDIPVLPPPLVILLPLLTTFITGWLSHSVLPRWANSAIALVVVLVVATIWALLSNQLVGGLVADVVVIAAYCSALAAGPLSGLQQWLTTKIPSPLDLVLGPSSPPVARPVPARASRFSPVTRATWSEKDRQQIPDTTQ